MMEDLDLLFMELLLMTGGHIVLINSRGVVVGIIEGTPQE